MAVAGRTGTSFSCAVYWSREGDSRQLPAASRQNRLIIMISVTTEGGREGGLTCYTTCGSTVGGCLATRPTEYSQQDSLSLSLSPLSSLRRMFQCCPQSGESRVPPLTVRPAVSPPGAAEFITSQQVLYKIFYTIFTLLCYTCLISYQKHAGNIGISLDNLSCNLSVKFTDNLSLSLSPC